MYMGLMLGMSGIVLYETIYVGDNLMMMWCRLWGDWEFIHTP